MTLKSSPVRTGFEWLLEEGRREDSTPSCLLPTLLPRDSFLKFLLMKYHNFYSIKIFKIKKKKKTVDLDSHKGVNSLSDLFQRVGSDS